MSVRPRRSVLYMPGSNARALEKGRDLPADGLIIDLEDAVAPEAKVQARDAVVKALQKGFGEREVLVRINGLDTRWWVEDINAAAALRPDGVLVPKVSSPRQLQDLAARLVDMEKVAQEAINRAEQSGIVFIDEIDKIAGREAAHGPDVSREGVQRDLLPIVEGSTVNTKYGAVRTDHILFVASGAFHTSKPSDLIPEFQGRFPIRVELRALTRDDFIRILTEPENALTRQYVALMETENVHLTFTADAVAALAEIAAEVNSRSENIGARRLHTVLERLLEELSFSAPELNDRTVTVDSDYVHRRLDPIVKNEDLSRYIL